MDQEVDSDFVVTLIIPDSDVTGLDRYYVTESAITEFHPGMIIQWTSSEMTVVSDNGSYQVIPYRELLN
jgi:hypothetical protein